MKLFHAVASIARQVFSVKGQMQMIFTLQYTPVTTIYPCLCSAKACLDDRFNNGLTVLQPNFRHGSQAITCLSVDNFYLSTEKFKKVGGCHGYENCGAVLQYYVAIKKSSYINTF